MELGRQRRIIRNRQLRACTECRKRKLKCDRQQPCASCARRNEAASCIYETTTQDVQSERERRVRAEARLAHLEQLVQELSNPREELLQQAGTVSSNNVAYRNGEDYVANGSLYNGPTHWSAMLEDIEELRTTITEFEDFSNVEDDLDVDEEDGISFLFGAMKPLSFQQVLSTFLPSRQDADRMVAAYFRAKAVAAPFLHTAQFSRLYRLFWDSPSTASPLWTSILFSVFYVATRTLLPKPATNTGNNRGVNLFALAAAQCLAIGAYYRPQRFAVEASVLFVQSICLAQSDIPPAVGMLFGTITRLATMMGYHRDPDSFSGAMSPFEKEIRRRTWSLCMQLDMLISFQLGLPSNIQFSTWDARPPTNLLDSDFDEETIQLPPARPESEPTELLFYIAKHRLMSVFEKIIRHTLSATDRPTDELKAIDQELRDTYAALPAVFQPRPMTDSIVDSPSVIVTRLCVYLIYQKCRCVLHRRYVTQGRQESVQTCHDSASDLVKRFLNIYQEFEPGGQLETERWFMTSITWHDFLLGCTTLCLTVCSNKHHASGSAGGTTIDVVGSLKLLQNTRAVFETHPTKSRDTRKVLRLVEAALLKFGSQNLPGAQDVASTLLQEAPPSSEWQDSWLWSQSTSMPVDDPTWAYMEQFLDLSNDDFMTESQS